ncbi:hypothetical protein DFR48_111116 [Ciceribacter lividus]|uniref:Uncharacterized protein n=1 Tax=Ciceribacter lividus TaxID=1197950 RepID=A0A6I7HJF5_9HYPH|nr:hypothetical protein DFR48_111116 [Ciceribacter lividus]
MGMYLFSPPSALPGISPSRGEIGKWQATQSLAETRDRGYVQAISLLQGGEKYRTAPHPISPLVGEMPGRAEGGDRGRRGRTLQ